MISKEIDLTGKQLKNYKIISKLGQGGMATVYKAHELSLNRVVALKVLSTHLTEDESYIKRFQREAQAAAQLNHPNIVQIFSIGEENGIYFFAMEFIKGQSLAQIRHDQDKLAPNETVNLIKQVAEALSDAHRIGLVHRDIKPSNIMIDSSGRAKVTDFGIAYFSQAKTKLTKDGSIIGTPEYLSPEQCEGKTVDNRSDIYSLGVTLYELLSGKTPYEADTPVSMLMKIVKGEFPPLSEVNPTLPKKLLSIVEKMMQKDPQLRYQKMEDVIRDLNSFNSIKNLPATMNLDEPMKVKQKKEVVSTVPQHNRWAAVIVAAVIVILMGGAFAAKMLYFDKRPKNDASQLLSSTTNIKENSEEKNLNSSSQISTQLSNPSTDSMSNTDQIQSNTNEGNPLLSAAPGSEEPLNKLASNSIPSSVPSSSSNSIPGSTNIKASIPSSITTHSQNKMRPPKNSCIITTVGKNQQNNLITPYIEKILSQKEYIIVDDPSATNNELSQLARVRIVIDIKNAGTTQLNYYGNTSEMTTIILSIKAVDLRTGKITSGPLTQKIEYTALNAVEKMKEASMSLMTQFLPLLESQINN